MLLCSFSKPKARESCLIRVWTTDMKILEYCVTLGNHVFIIWWGHWQVPIGVSNGKCATGNLTTIPWNKGSVQSWSCRSRWLAGFQFYCSSEPWRSRCCRERREHFHIFTFPGDLPLFIGITSFVKKNSDAVSNLLNHQKYLSGLVVWCFGRKW